MMNRKTNEKNKSKTNKNFKNNLCPSNKLNKKQTTSLIVWIWKPTGWQVQKQHKNTQ